jgi:hypothetical protein
LVDLLSLKQSNSVNAGAALPNLEAAAAAVSAAVTGKDGEVAQQGHTGSSLAGSLAAVQSYLSNISKHQPGDASTKEGSKPGGGAAGEAGTQQQQQGSGGSGGAGSGQQQQQSARDASKRSLSVAAGAENLGATAAAGVTGTAAGTPPGGNAVDSGPFDQLLSEAAAAEQARAAKRRRVLGSSASEEVCVSDSPAGAQRQQQGAWQGTSPGSGHAGAGATGGDVAPLVTRDSRASSDSHVPLPPANSGVGSGVGSMPPPPPVDMAAAGAGCLGGPAESLGDGGAR